MKLTLFAFIFMTSGLLACSQDRKPSQVPALVNNTLLAEFPDAINLEWKKKQNLFEADFKLAFTDYSALVDATGQFVMCKNELTGFELPTSIKNVLQNDYKAYIIEKLEKVEKAGHVYYQVELEKDNQALKQVFTVDGQPFKNQKYWE